MEAVGLWVVLVTFVRSQEVCDCQLGDSDLPGDDNVCDKSYAQARSCESEGHILVLANDAFSQNLCYVFL